ncbi:AAA family ATPase [Halapricum desulfuricans]|uniref:AAA family ATPase n=1 Tax=Halapricum desulfuricans TaxID=2841257 RepID=UPI001E2F28DB|nr:AAA family ATPase [Halapricum desulfuricans]
MSRLILCIVGPSCAGKTTSAEYIQERRDTDHFEASEFVKSRYSNSTFSGSLMEFVKTEFDREGKETFARPVCGEISEADESEAIISGFRTKQEVDFIKKKFSDVLVVGLYANSLLRYQRKLRRDNPESEYEYQDFLQKDFIEYNFGIMEMFDSEEDILIVNEGTLDNLYTTIDEQILSKIDSN